ncbi:MAG: hypothetical protein N2595_06335 [bacterium]|nr:hypothetical protein [bacterium]
MPSSASGGFIFEGMAPCLSHCRTLFLRLSSHATVGLAWAAGSFAVAALCCHLVTHHPFYDECIHIRHLWRLSIGDRAHHDFWCSYPISAYVLTLPFFRLLPEAAISVLALRALMFVPLAALAALFAWHARRVGSPAVWGVVPFAMLASTPGVARFLVEYSTDHWAALAAGAALMLMLTASQPHAVGAAAYLSILSLFFAPKYFWYLIPGGLAMFATACVTTRAALRVLAWAVGGVLLALLTVIILHAAVRVSLWDELLWVFVVQARYNVSRMMPRLAFFVLQFLLAHWWIAILLGAGLVGAWRSRSHATWRQWGPQGAILAGTVVSLLALRQGGAQYFAPVLLTLLLFVPYAGRCFGSRQTQVLLTLLMAMLACAVCCWNLARATRDFVRTPLNTREDPAPHLVVSMTMPGVHRLYAMQKLLDMIPRDERVVAVWYMHPLFRRDLTFVTQDDRPSLVPLMPPHHPIRCQFDPTTFYSALTAAPPAYISPVWLGQNYPPGWMEVCRDFVNSTNLYELITIAGERAFLRKDLLPGSLLPGSGLNF